MRTSEVKNPKNQKKTLQEPVIDELERRQIVDSKW